MFGEVPEELGNLVSLEELVIYSNNLTRRIPSSIGKLEQLRVIRAGLNALSGPIPAEISECESLEILGRFLWEDSRNNTAHVKRQTGVKINYLNTKSLKCSGTFFSLMSLWFVLDPFFSLGLTPSYTSTPVYPCLH